jgi:Ni/Co efflux regulator RcnB
MRRLWDSGWARLAVLALVVAAVGGAVAAAQRDPGPTAAERASAERARLVTLHREQARVRAAARRDPAIRRERARLRAEQRAHFARGRPARGSRRGQEALVGSLERSITRDARRRFRAGELDKRTIETECIHLVRPQALHPPPPPLSASSAGYECTAATVKLDTSVSRTGKAILGFPFWARVSFETGRYAWCKINLLPSEHGIGDSLAFVSLPPVCDLLKGQGPA